ncbi:MAG TPA: sulfotransferase [Gammaproteobacteria bacterium]|nr:sulfotransferase [Gammaproteobacteria bacterium]
MNDRTGLNPLPPDAVRRMRAALAAHRRGEVERAEAEYGWLTETFPRFADAWHYYGLLCHQRGESDRALTLLRTAQMLAPDHVIFLLNFGRVLSELGKYSRAVVCLGRALRLAPDNDQALIAYAQAQVEAGRGAEAIDRLERRVQGRPADWRLWAWLGKCREQSGNYPEAKLAFGEAATLAPAPATAEHLRRVRSALESGETITAELEFRAALEIEPHCAAAYLRLARMAMEAGEFGRMREWAQAALERDERLWKAWALLAARPEEYRDAAFVARLQEAVRKGGDDAGVAPLHFALGWIFEYRNDYDEAFASYARGNRTQGRHRIYDRGAQEAYTSKLIGALDRNFVERAATIGEANAGAIFICGMPRSGTTLVEAMLASHPQVRAGGEMRFVHDWLRRADALESEGETGPWLRDASDATLRGLAREWVAHLRAAAAGSALVTDKMPGNYHLLGLIHVCLPNAPIVYVRRDPRDSGLSCFTTCFDHGHFFSHALDSIGHYYRLQERLMEHWREVLPAGRIIDVEYEALIARPEQHARRLLAALELPWDPACLRFHEARRDVRTASLIQVRRPLYRTSVGRWRRFERHLGPLLEELARPLAER